MITEDYCSFKIAKLLKEKGFEIDTNKDYWKIGEDGTMYFMSSIGAYTSNPNNEYAFYRPENSYPCPTHQKAMKWLREVHGIFIAINNDDLDFNWQCYDLINRDGTLDPKILSESYAGYKTYEQAVEAALKYALKNLI